MSRRWALSGVVCWLLLCLALTGCSGVDPRATPESDDLTLGWRSVDLHSITLPTSDPIVGTTSSLDGQRPTLINFWASSCAPCRQELPLLEKVSQAGSVDVVGVSRDRFERYAVAVADKAHLTYTNYLDSDARYSEQFDDVMPTSAIPTSALVVDGEVVAVHIGAIKTLADMESGLELAGSDPP